MMLADIKVDAICVKAWPHARVILMSKAYNYLQLCRSVIRNWLQLPQLQLIQYYNLSTKVIYRKPAQSNQLPCILCADWLLTMLTADWLLTMLSVLIGYSPCW